MISDKLIKAVAKGNHDAFREFYDITYPLIYRFARYFLTCKEDCEEVVAEVFYIIWSRKNSLTEVKNIKSWLYIVCRNEVFHFLKQKKKFACVSIDDMSVDLHIERRETDAELIENEMFDLYHKAVDELPERCKLIFLMVREEHLKYKEIAEILSIAEGTVAQQMNTAISRITETVRKNYEL